MLTVLAKSGFLAFQGADQAIYSEICRGKAILRSFLAVGHLTLLTFVPEYMSIFHATLFS